MEGNTGTNSIGDNRSPPPHHPVENPPSTYWRGPPAWWVAIGSGLGGMARIWLAALVDIATGTAFPVGILSVNVLGSFAIGLAAARLTGPRDANRSTQCRHFFMTGFCGGFTTFSFFSLQTLHLLETGRPLMALLYSVSTLGLAIAAVWLGHRLGR